MVANLWASVKASMSSNMPAGAPQPATTRPACWPPARQKVIHAGLTGSAPSPALIDWLAAPGHAENGQVDDRRLVRRSGRASRAASQVALPSVGTVSRPVGDSF